MRSRLPTVVPWVLALPLFLGGCVEDRPGPLASEGGGRIEVRWTGSSEGGLTVPVTGLRCVDQQMVELLAFRADTGVAFALWLSDSVRTDYYNVYNPASPAPVRPGAGMALRWFAGNYVAGFEADGGWVLVERSRGDTIAGKLEVRLRAVDRPDTLLLTGTFHGVPLVADSTCPVRHL